MKYSFILHFMVVKEFNSESQNKNLKINHLLGISSILH